MFDEAGNTTTGAIINGIKYAAESGCVVINMSFGSFIVDSDIADFIQRHPEIHYVCSAGDFGNAEYLFPASMKER